MRCPAARIVSSRWATTTTVRSGVSRSSVSAIERSETASRALVGSSSTMMLRSASNARAIASRCFCPPESPLTMSPSGVCNPCGSDATNASALAALNASRSSASVADGFANRRFSSIVPGNRNGSWPTNANRRRHAGVVGSIASPSIRTGPLRSGSDPTSARISVVLPAPDGPQMATNVPCRMPRRTSRSTAGDPG